MPPVKTKVQASANGKITKPDIPAVIAELVNLQRQRSVIIKSRIMQVNRLRNVVAGELGYTSDMDKKARTEKMKEATQKIKDVVKGVDKTFRYRSIILATWEGVKSFNTIEDSLEKSMKDLARSLPVASWAEEDDQRGFGVLSLATVVGEAGNLSNYPNPGKLWKRFGCAPHTFNDKTKMGSTWKGGKEGKLPAEEWVKFGYTPRRRSIAYVIGTNLLKNNIVNDKEAEKVAWCGPYRDRYEEAKVRFKENHPEYTKGWCHNHAMLLMAKLVLKNLWIEWKKVVG